MWWNLLNRAAAVVEKLSADAGLSSLMARLLVLRGITAAAEAYRFLSPSLEQMHSPYLMRGMREAVDRVAAAIANREDILIYGDYDVDGTTAVVILKTAIELCSGATRVHLR